MSPIIKSTKEPLPICTTEVKFQRSSGGILSHYTLKGFAYTNSSVLNTLKEDNSDLALKVVLEIKIKENSNNTFEPTNETVIDETKIPRPDFRAPTVETFTDFIQEVAKILNTYEDTAFEDFFDILDKEIRKYHYRGCKFYELTENYEFRRIMAEKLDLFKSKSVPILKGEINELADIIKHETYNKNVKELLDYINSLYRGDAREKFGKILSDLKAYDNSTPERPKHDLIKIIKYGVRAIVFNHYTDLNINVRRELKKEIATFLKKIKEASSSTPKTNLFPYKPALRKSKTTVKIYGYNIAIKDKNAEHHPKIDPRSIGNKTHVLKLNTSDEKHQLKATNLKEENSSQQLQITYLSTDESSDETIEGSSTELSLERQQEFNSHTYVTLYTEEVNNTTENPEIIYKSDLKSKLVQRILIEESSSRLPTVQPTTTPEIRFLSDEDLRRSILPPLPEEELSIDVFDREEKERQKSLANKNRIATVQHGIKNYIKRMRNLQKEIKHLKKIDYYNQNSRINIISNGDKIKTKQKTGEKTRKNKNKKSKAKKHKDKNKKMESKETKRTKHVNERQSDEYEGRVQTATSKNDARETKRDVKITDYAKEDLQDLESDTEIVKNNDSQAYKLKIHKQKKNKVTRNKSTKATKTNEKHKGTTDAMTSGNIRVRRSLKPLASANNNAGNTTGNNNRMKLIKTAIKVTTKVSSATLNVTDEVKQKRIRKTVTDEYVTKANTTPRYRRVLEFSSPPLYDQPFFEDHIFLKGLSS